MLGSILGYLYSGKLTSVARFCTTLGNFYHASSGSGTIVYYNHAGFVNSINSIGQKGLGFRVYASGCSAPHGGRGERSRGFRV